MNLKQQYYQVGIQFIVLVITITSVVFAEEPQNSNPTSLIYKSEEDFDLIFSQPTKQPVELEASEKDPEIMGLGGIVPDNEVYTLLTNCCPTIAAQIQFEFDSANVDYDNTETFNMIANCASSLKNFSKTVIVVAGHTDSKGSYQYNLKLSHKRARAVAHDLITYYQIHPSRLIIAGFGEMFPIANNSTSDGRRTNRRVEFIKGIPPIHMHGQYKV